MEYPGACYHVINRGNYRGHVFESKGARAAFELGLAEGAARFHWKVHGWVVMGNHYHLAVETPEANLSSGMQWVQTTFSARCHRFRGEHGPVFQGRYRAIHVQPGEPLGRVCHYIDLNPVRAGLAAVATLENYEFGSFARLVKPATRPSWFSPHAALTGAGGLADSAPGREKYRAFLQWLQTEIGAGREQEHQRLCAGWAIGEDDFWSNWNSGRSNCSIRGLWTPSVDGHGGASSGIPHWPRPWPSCPRRCGRTTGPPPGGKRKSPPP